MLINYFLSFITIVFCFIGFLVAYNKISKNKPKKLSKKNTIILLVLSTIQYNVTLLVYSYMKIFISFSLIFIMLKVEFKENNKITLIKLVLIYLYELAIETILSFILILTGLSNIQIFDKKLLLVKNLFSILVILILMLVFSIKSNIRFCKKLIKYVIKKKSSIIFKFLIALFIFVSLSIFSFVININQENYLITIMFLFITINCFYITINYYNKLNLEIEKQEILLEYILKYEKLLEKDSINRHELLNDLIILSSYKDKNSKEFSSTLNGMIKEYCKINNNEYKNIKNIPSGIKGIIYYKINDINHENIKLKFYCSKNIDKFICNYNNKKYLKICKSLGIFLDNAIESAKSSTEKLIIIDIYEEDDNLIFYIENSISGTVNIKKIKRKYESTKGQGRGLGLYIVKNLLRNNNDIKYEQELKNNRFVTKLILSSSKNKT